MAHLTGIIIVATIVAVAIVGAVFFLRHDRRPKDGHASGEPAAGGPSTTLTCGDATSQPTEQAEKAPS